MLLIVGCDEGGGERGGDAKREAWKRVFGVEFEESHVNAEGSNIFATPRICYGDLIAALGW